MISRVSGVGEKVEKPNSWTFTPHCCSTGRSACLTSSTIRAMSRIVYRSWALTTFCTMMTRRFLSPSTRLSTSIDRLAEVDDLIHHLGADLVDQLVAQLDHLRLEVEGRVLGGLDLEALDDRELEVDARADHAHGASQVELQGMLAVIHHHEDAGHRLEEFEHRASRDEGGPRCERQEPIRRQGPED